MSRPRSSLPITPRSGAGRVDPEVGKRITDDANALAAMEDYLSKWKTDQQLQNRPFQAKYSYIHGLYTNARDLNLLDINPSTLADQKGDINPAAVQAIVDKVTVVLRDLDNEKLKAHMDAIGEANPQLLQKIKSGYVFNAANKKLPELAAKDKVAAQFIVSLVVTIANAHINGANPNDALKKFLKTEGYLILDRKDVTWDKLKPLDKIKLKLIGYETEAQFIALQKLDPNKNTPANVQYQEKLGLSAADVANLTKSSSAEKNRSVDLDAAKAGMIDSLNQQLTQLKSELKQVAQAAVELYSGKDKFSSKKKEHDEALKAWQNQFNAMVNAAQDPAALLSGVIAGVNAIPGVKKDLTSTELNKTTLFGKPSNDHHFTRIARGMHQRFDDMQSGGKTSDILLDQYSVLQDKLNAVAKTYKGMMTLSAQISKSDKAPAPALGKDEKSGVGAGASSVAQTAKMLSQAQAGSGNANATPGATVVAAAFASVAAPAAPPQTASASQPPLPEEAPLKLKDLDGPTDISTIIDFLKNTSTRDGISKKLLDGDVTVSNRSDIEGNADQIEALKTSLPSRVYAELDKQCRMAIADASIGNFKI